MQDTGGRILDAGFWRQDSGCGILDAGYGIRDAWRLRQEERISGSYRELEVYQLAHELGVLAHRLSLQLPKHELFETGSQLRRAAKSVSVNIVEGYGRRRYKAEFVRFLIYAQASCDETAEWLAYTKDCYKDFSVETESLIEQVGVVGRKLNRFISAVEANHQSPK
jgi:four helix bundle protein